MRLKHFEVEGEDSAGVEKTHLANQAATLLLADATVNTPSSKHAIGHAPGHAPEHAPNHKPTHKPVHKPNHRPSVSDKSIEEFQDTNHVEVVRSRSADGHAAFDYRLRADGHVMSLLKTEATQSGLDQAERALNTMALRMEKEIERDNAHPVRFSTVGEDIVRKRVMINGGGESTGDMIKARAPKLDELYGIRAALKHSGPSDLLKDGKAVKIYFLSDVQSDGLGLNVASEVRDKNNEPAIYVPPNGARISHAKITEADLSAAERSKSWMTRPPTIEGDLVHEFAHVNQDKLGLVSGGNNLDNNTAASIGWHHYVDQRQGIDLWMIKTRDKDKSGKNIWFTPDETDPFGGWVRCNETGLHLDPKGAPARNGNQQKMTADQVAAHALIKPPTWYFNNPCEEYAEAMKLYRLSASSRAELGRVSPQLYKVVAEKDRIEIAIQYKGKMVRAADGRIVPSSESAQASRGKNSETPPG